MVALYDEYDDEYDDGFDDMEMFAVDNANLSDSEISKQSSKKWKKGGDEAEEKANDEDLEERSRYFKKVKGWQNIHRDAN